MAPPSVRFELAIDDVVDLQNFLQRPLFRLVTAIGIGAIALGLVLLVVGDSPSLALFVMAYGALDLAIAHFRPFRRLAAGLRARAIVGTDFEFVLDPEAGLRWTERGGAGSITWSTFSAVREDARLLAFMTGGVVRATIPKRAFGSAAEMKAFRDEARRRIDEARR